MKKRALTVVLIVFILLAAFSINAYADMGPKPSVVVELTGLGDEICYGTLLSKYETNGPNRAYTTGEEIPDYLIDSYDTADWQARAAFIAYEDSDGYYYLQEHWRCNASSGFAWTYYPPEPFKILLYFPQSDTFAVTQVMHRYAFDSYFTVDLTSAENGLVTATQSYDYTNEIVSLLVRIAATIVLELVLVLAFGFKNKKALALISAVNVITQVALNVALFFVDFKSGSMAFAFYYVVLELVVFAAEAAIYLIGFKRLNYEQTKTKTVLYALAANALSFGAGLGLAHIIPGIF